MKRLFLRIDFASSPFYVNTELRDFPAADARGAPGSIALDWRYEHLCRSRRGAANPPPITDQLSFPALDYPFSQERGRFGRTCRATSDWLNDNPDAPIGDLCYTTNVSRSQFLFRFAVPARRSRS